MTIYEFEVEYDKLIKLSPRFYNKAHHKAATFAAVRHMDQIWFKETVKKCVANPEVKINIVKEARSYRNLQWRVKETKQWLEEQAVKTPESVKGLQNFLQTLGVSTTAEAMELMRNQNKISDE